jgi:hypothetical protein
VESGEVYEEDDGKFYYSEHRRSSVETRGDSTKAEKKSDIDAKKLNSVFMELIRDKPDPKEKWIVMAGKKPSKSIDNAASDNDMAVLQESFDAVTRVTCAIRKVAMELIRTGQLNEQRVGGEGSEAVQDDHPEPEHCGGVAVQGQV